MLDRLHGGDSVPNDGQHHPLLQWLADVHDLLRQHHDVQKHRVIGSDCELAGLYERCDVPPGHVLVLRRMISFSNLLSRRAFAPGGTARRRGGATELVVVIAIAGLGLTACSPQSRTPSDSPTKSDSPSISAPSGPPVSASDHNSWASFMVPCMEQNGWKLRVVSEREIEPQGVNAEQAAVYQQDLDACNSTYEAAHPPPSVNAESVSGLYKQELVTMACLQKLGIQVDAPPSEQAYVDEYLSQKFSSWSAYAHVGEHAAMPFAEVEKKCPQPELTGSK